MILLAALAGAAIVGGLVLLAAELLRRAPPPGTPPAPRFGRPMSSATRRRVLIALAAGLAGAGRHPVAGRRRGGRPPVSSSCPS